MLLQLVFTFKKLTFRYLVTVTVMLYFKSKFHVCIDMMHLEYSHKTKINLHRAGIVYVHIVQKNTPLICFNSIFGITLNFIEKISTKFERLNHIRFLSSIFVHIGHKYGYFDVVNTLYSNEIYSVLNKLHPYHAFS